LTPLTSRGVLSLTSFHIGESSFSSTERTYFFGLSIIELTVVNVFSATTGCSRESVFFITELPDLCPGWLKTLIVCS